MIRNFVKIFLILLCAVFLFSTNASFSHLALKSPAQKNFETWLSNFSALDKAKLLENPALIQARLSLGAPPGKQEFTLRVNSEETFDNLFRILSLAKESNIFSLSTPSPTPRENRIAFNIKNQVESFDAQFTNTDIEGNAPAQLMLKLFQIYASSKEKQAP